VARNILIHPLGGLRESYLKRIVREGLKGLMEWVFDLKMKSGMREDGWEVGGMALFKLENRSVGFLRGVMEAADGNAVGEL